MRVFISSTALDLSQHRQVAERVVLQMGWQPELVMEHESILGGPIVESCCRRVWDCDLFVSIVGYRCGYIPSTQQGGSGFDSLTAYELGTWVRRVRTQGGFPPIIMFAEAEGKQPGEGEGEVAAAAQTLLRAKVHSLEVVHSFPLATTSADSARLLDVFASKLRTQLASVKAMVSEHQQRLAQSARLAAEERARRAEADLAAQKNAGWATGAVAFGLGALAVWLANSDE